MSSVAIEIPRPGFVTGVRPRAIPPRAEARARVAVVVERMQPELPSLAAARLVALRRAGGAAVRLVEVERAELGRLGMLAAEVDRIDLVRREGPLDTGDAALAALVRSGERHPLVPDFGDLAPERTRLLPIAIAGAAGGARSLGVVLHEVREYMRRHHAPDLVFVDDAINARRLVRSGVFGGLVDAIQTHAPGVQWMARLLVGATEADDALSRRRLRAAASAGLRSAVLVAEGGERGAGRGANRGEEHGEEHGEERGEACGDDRGAATAARAEVLAAQAIDAGIAVRVVAGAAQSAFRAVNLRSAISTITPFDAVALKD